MAVDLAAQRKAQQEELRKVRLAQEKNRAGLKLIREGGARIRSGEIEKFRNLKIKDINRELARRSAVRKKLSKRAKVLEQRIQGGGELSETQFERVAASRREAEAVRRRTDPEFAQELVRQELQSRPTKVQGRTTLPSKNRQVLERFGTSPTQQGKKTGVFVSPRTGRPVIVREEGATNQDILDALSDKDAFSPASDVGGFMKAPRAFKLRVGKAVSVQNQLLDEAPKNFQQADYLTLFRINEAIAAREFSITKHGGFFGKAEEVVSTSLRRLGSSVSKFQNPIVTFDSEGNKQREVGRSLVDDIFKLEAGTGAGLAFDVGSFFVPVFGTTRFVNLLASTGTTLLSAEGRHMVAANPLQSTVAGGLLAVGSFGIARSLRISHLNRAGGKVQFSTAFPKPPSLFSRVSTKATTAKARVAEKSRAVLNRIRGTSTIKEVGVDRASIRVIDTQTVIPGQTNRLTIGVVVKPRGSDKDIFQNVFKIAERGRVSTLREPSSLVGSSSRSISVTSSTSPEAINLFVSTGRIRNIPLIFASKSGRFMLPRQISVLEKPTTLIKPASPINMWRSTSLNMIAGQTTATSTLFPSLLTQTSGALLSLLFPVSAVTSSVSTSSVALTGSSLVSGGRFGLASSLSNKQDQASGQFSLQASAQGISLFSAQASALSLAQESLLEQKLVTKQVTRQITKQKTAKKLKPPRLVSKTKIKILKVPTVPGVPVLGGKKRSGQIQKGNVEEYALEVRRNRKFQEISRGHTKGQALFKGSRVAANTIVATFRARKTGGYIKPKGTRRKGFKPSGVMFRSPKPRSNMKGSNTYIERRRFRLDSPAERATIKEARRIKFL